MMKNARSTGQPPLGCDAGRNRVCVHEEHLHYRTLPLGRRNRSLVRLKDLWEESWSAQLPPALCYSPHVALHVLLWTAREINRLSI